MVPVRNGLKAHNDIVYGAFELPGLPRHRQSLEVAEERRSALRRLGPEGPHVALVPGVASAQLPASCEELLTLQPLASNPAVVSATSVQATTAGGAVEVRAARSGDSLWLEVSDTGRGVPHGEREHIYKPFYTTRHSGTGLGLSITREVVERHGGRVELESEMGRGSTFRLVLPCRSAAPSLAAQGAVP